MLVVQYEAVCRQPLTPLLRYYRCCCFGFVSVYFLDLAYEGKPTFRYRWYPAGHPGRSYRAGVDAPDGDRHFRRFLRLPDAGACVTNDVRSGPRVPSDHGRAHDGYGG